MNQFQSVIYCPLFLIITCHSLADHSQVNFCWFKSQEVFHKWFNLILVRKFIAIHCYSKHFVENEKDGKNLVQTFFFFFLLKCDL